MPEPEAVEAVDKFRAALLRQDATAAKELVSRYGPIWRDIQGDLTALLETIEDQQMSFAQVKRLERLKALERQVEREVISFARFADRTITSSQSDAVNIALRAVKATVDDALPVGIDTNLLGRAGIEWNRLPTSAFENFVGISGDGKPLANLLDPLGVEARRGIVDGIGQGIAQGRGPRRTAAIIRQRFGMPLTRALRISRTETLRAYRGATSAQYAANRDVIKGWRRLAKTDDLTCFACIALDGRLYETAEIMDAHVNCRCAMVPETVSYADLGLDVPADTRQRELGPDWFKKQPAATQQAMMGAAKFTAWQDGKFNIEDMAKVTTDPTWGAAAVEKTLKELVA